MQIIIILLIMTYIINDEHFSCDRHCSKFFIFIDSFNPYNNSY